MLNLFPAAGEARRKLDGKQQAPAFPRLWIPGCVTLCRGYAWPAGGFRVVGGRDRQGCYALGELGAQLGTVWHPHRGPFQSQLRPRAPARHAAVGASAPPAGIPQCPTQSNPKTPTMGSLKPRVCFFFPRGCRDPTLQPTRPDGGQGPCQGERLPSPLPPLTLFGWTEGCLGESFSTLFHIHNGLNIGEQSGTWRAKPSPWSEPMTSPPR